MSTLLAPTSDELQLHQLTEQKPKPVEGGLSEELKARLQREIGVALDTVSDPVVYAVLRVVFNEIVRVFEILWLIERKLHELDTLLENLSILEVLQFEIRYLIELIEGRTMQTPGISEQLVETLAGVSYGMSHDVKRVFERELTSNIRTKSIPVVYGKILHSHGLLRNCFQQTLITLLQVFNPKLDPIQLFDDFEQRLQQSLLLCNDLSSLMRAVKEAQSHSTSEALNALVGKAIEFRDGSMQYLMYRDWRGYEHHSLALITCIQCNFDATDLLHQFGCYLELLYSHVKLRAVLKDIFPQSTEDAGEGA